MPFRVFGHQLRIRRYNDAAPVANQLPLTQLYQLLDVIFVFSSAKMRLLGVFLLQYWNAQLLNWRWNRI